ncbi:hypothetical protein TNIN_76021 [Trichonephila inaurata madagascariensis]|uniref:Uncharacterized protein n=1 Tax=Trichonephila inaurata madagascariensis TaxID=2747483 RepID=A0A8X6IRD9_9ARAC|nr:hypothetical protein TNIN_76021 [Trichonephila inaurata madagascariensis]
MCHYAVLLLLDFNPETKVEKRKTPSITQPCFVKLRWNVPPLPSLSLQSGSRTKRLSLFQHLKFFLDGKKIQNDDEVVSIVLVIPVSEVYSSACNRCSCRQRSLTKATKHSRR